MVARRPAPVGDEEAHELGVTVLGLEVSPIYRTPEGEASFPVVMRTLRRSVSRALRRALYEFSKGRTTHRPEHFHVLGKRALVKAVWDVDQKLARVSDGFDFLLQVTPANSQEAWAEFKRRRYEREPTLHYRHLPMEPSTLKRSLFQVPIERVEDPALSLLFRQKQEELDRQITMLADRNTARFLHGSLALYGPIDEELVGTARELLELLPVRAREDSRGGYVGAEEFAERARAELEHYGKILPSVTPRVQIRKDVATGLMVSRGELLIGADTSVPTSRVDALLQHEIGVHVLTWHNGAAQPFQQLRSGLAGYDALQEGVAVLAEYLVGGLSRPRLRLLAGRVLAARSVIEGARFVDTYRFLVEEYGFDQRTAFVVSLRVHRGGGLTKDAVYLQGLMQVLEYLGRGGRLRTLFVGKIAAEHVPILHELQYREVLGQAPLLPRFLDREDVQARLEGLRQGRRVLDLIQRNRT